MKKYASIWQRLLAFFIDWFIGFLIGLYCVLNIFKATDLNSILNNLLTYIIISVWYCVAYYCLNTYLISRFGGSIGKMLTGIRITDSNGKNLTFLKAFFREFIAKTPSGLFFGLGFWWMLKDRNNQTWHDQLSDTLVVIKDKKFTLIGILTLGSLLLVSTLLIINMVKLVKENMNIYEGVVQDTIQSIDYKQDLENIENLRQLEEQEDFYKQFEEYNNSDIENLLQENSNLELN